MLFYLNFLALLILLLPLNVITNEEVQYIKLEILRRLSCSLGLTNKNCAVDGGWSFWSFWGPCVGACGQVGLRWRTRECNSPKPANNGLPCVGNYHECKECRKEACSLEDYREFIKCDLIRSKEFELIEEIDKKYSSLTTKCLQSECHYKTAHNILQDDTDLYWNALHCVKHNIGCPEYGGWSNWGDWTDCSSHCGYGKQITCRSCDHPRPTNPKYKCTGNNCTTISCMGTKCDSIDGKFHFKLTIIIPM
ncbi:hypothetical protein O3M35_003294 [Rhynocoris fuscipes]|uniref:Uncharacterized protein n=1 Tax=Rhynocoris fuscipes TaxID=488301 RepID=A0AAW1CJK5_9HEMI